MCNEADSSVCGAAEVTEQTPVKSLPEPSKATEKDSEEVIPDVPNAPII